MSNAERAMRKLNIHGVNPGELVGGHEIPDLTTSDVYAALGFGSLSIDSYNIGMAVQVGDDKSIQYGKAHCFGVVKGVFENQGWSATRPFQNTFRKEYLAGTISDHELRSKKEEAGRKLMFYLGSLALTEIIGLELKDCTLCNGQGFTRKAGTPIDCKSCRGIGKRKEALSNDYKRRLLGVEYEAYMKTWTHRYKICLSEISGKVNEFRDHLEKMC